ncbi:MAG: glycoside hydrolase [Glycomyces artemisiae]|uniref:Glycoside hydrolase n=1 Tax=Glycomyces artemisiae TaxID=1076443 RepID=A0A850CCV0_9ACTN|nr:glycoside hydrolase [Glycomyces artemisiae]
MRRIGAAIAAPLLLLAGCTGADADPLGQPLPEDGADTETAAGSWLYQLSGYEDGTLDAVAAAPQTIAVVDLARDGGEGYWTAEEIDALHEAGKTVYAYFSMGSIETYRPEYDAVAAADSGLVLNQWGDWPDEYFVKYWEQDWWDLVMEPRLDQAAAAGFDGVYLDVPNAYEEIDLALVPGETRDTLARKMADLVIAADDYTADGLAILPQNSPELVDQDGYLDAIDGIGIEELWFLNADTPCDEEWCAENLANTRAIHDAGKLILAVDYAADPANKAAACAHYAEEGFWGAVAGVDLDAVYEPCQ